MGEDRVNARVGSYAGIARSAHPNPMRLKNASQSGALRTEAGVAARAHP